MARGDGRWVREFIATHARITKASFAGMAGEPLILRPWQEALVDRIFARRADKRRRHRTALVMLPRKNGKSSLIAAVALYGLVMDADGAEVYSVAGDRQQARLVFDTAKRMIELDPDLAKECRTFRDAIEIRQRGSVYRALSSESPLREGLSPTLTVVDEVHVIDRSLWDVFALAMGARVDPLMIGITTAGARYDSHGMDTLCYSLWEYGRRVAAGEIDDPAFYMESWAADQEDDYRDPATWAKANPGLGDILDPEQLAAALGPTPEAEFRTKHLDQWVVSAESALPQGAWEACADRARAVTKEEPIVLGFDGAWTMDSAALVGCTVSGGLHVFEIDSWERPIGDLHWRVDAATVDAAVEAAFDRYNVVELAVDPHEWREQIQRWARKYGVRRVTEWPTNSLDRIVPAWKEFYTTVVERRMTHDGSPGLARHVGNAVLKIDQRGARPTKEYGTSGRKIDRLMAALIARDRAAAHAGRPPKRRARFGSF